MRSTAPRRRIPVWFMVVPIAAFWVGTLFSQGPSATTTLAATTGSTVGGRTSQGTSGISMENPAPPAMAEPNMCALKSGESCSTTGLSLSVENPLFEERSFVPPFTAALRATVRITNSSNENRVTEIKTGRWFATDDQGRKRKIGVVAWPNRFGEWGTNLLKRRSTENVEIWVEGSLDEFKDVQRLWIVIPELSTLRNATWEIKVPH